MAGYIGTRIAVPETRVESKSVINITATTTSLTGLSYTPTQVEVFHNGVRLVDGTDFTATNGTSITLTTAAQNGDQVVVLSSDSLNVANVVPATGGTFSGNVTFSGDVGIGTTSPAQKLDVSGSIAVSDTTTSTKRLQLDSGASSHTINSANYGSDMMDLNIQAENLKFNTGLIGVAERMRIDSSGNVGIGTSSPQREVQIHDANATNAFLAINHVGVGSGATDGMLLGVDGNNDAIIHNYENSNMIFRTNDIERMRINGSGGIYFNTSSNQGTTGSGTLNILVSGGDAINLRHTVNGNHVFNIQQDGTNPTNYLHFSKNGSNVGSIYCTTTSTSYNTSSDYRLKENVTPLDGAADRLAQIPVHRFNFTANPDTTVDGFLAHEVQAFVPEAVTGEKDAVDENGNPIHQGIDQSKLVPLLTAALQEALQKIDALEARVTALETN
jgi:hypothetical protein